MQWIEDGCFNLIHILRVMCDIFQAFAIAVACMDGKIADRKGYEYMRKLSGSSEPPDPTQVSQLSMYISSMTSPFHTFEIQLLKYEKFRY